MLNRAARPCRTVQMAEKRKRRGKEGKNELPVPNTDKRAAATAADSAVKRPEFVCSSSQVTKVTSIGDQFWQSRVDHMVTIGLSL